MKKQIISGLLAVCMAVSCLAVPFNDGDNGLINDVDVSAETYGNYEYTILDDGTVRIDKYTGTATSVSIPSYIGSREVSTIGQKAFRDNKYLKSVTMPSTITLMTSSDWYVGAFQGCTSLTSVTLSSSLLNISDSTFSGCTSLKSITIPSSVCSIGWDAFENCSSLSSVTIGSSVTSIDKYAFENCTSLKSIKIPKNVTDFGIKIFIGCHEDFAIQCYKDSVAETYAKDNEIPYTLLDMSVPKVTMKSSYTPTTSSVTINWNRVSSATGYMVYRYNSSTKKWVKQKTIYGSSTTSYKQTGLKAGTTYKYRVKAFIERGGKNYYGSVSSTIKTTTKPAQVTMKTASKTKTAVRINWKKVTGANGYQIQRYNSSTKKWVTVKTIKSGSTLTYKQTGLKKGTAYKYRVRAYRVINGKKVYGTWSKTKKVTTKS